MDVTHEELDRANEVLIETAGAMCADAWFQVCLRRRNKLPADVAESRFLGMCKMADAVMELPPMFVVTVKEQGGKILNDLEIRGRATLDMLPQAVTWDLMRG